MLDRDQTDAVEPPGHEISVFAPTREPYGINWAEQVMGDVIRPVYDEWQSCFEWLWLSRHLGAYNSQQPPRGCELPLGFRRDGIYRCLVVRCGLHEPVKEVRDLMFGRARDAGCHIERGGWRRFDRHAYFGGSRLGLSYVDSVSRARRVKRVTQFLNATSRLVLDGLVPREEGRWIPEDNSHRTQNPHGSPWESVHHYYCNATATPASVRLQLVGDDLRVSTHWMGPVVLSATSDELRTGIDVAVRF